MWKCMTMKTQIILAVLLVNLYAKNSGAQSLESIDFRMAQQLAKTVGEELWTIGGSITKRTEVQESFAEARVVNKSGTRLVDEIAKEIKAMLDVRIAAVRRIVKVAEDLPVVHENETIHNMNFTFIKTGKKDVTYKEFLRLKEIKDRLLEAASQKDANYTKKKKPDHGDGRYCYKRDIPEYDPTEEPDYGCYAKFNETLDLKAKSASVFTPTDVFSLEVNMTMRIDRSKGLDKAYFANYRADQTLGWQYFCNSTGWFRHFPATNWTFHPVNNYDCRTRNWFSGAAVSSKDVIILVERSGSMLGTRIEIAIDLIRNLLDTLTPNDFFNVIQFNDTADFLIKCATGLVQATTQNIFEYKNALGTIEPNQQSDLAKALVKTFDILNAHKRNCANCNQAIMLITDNVEYNQTIQDIFEKYNWKRGNNVRVFTYLIGDQISVHDYEQTKLMACYNRGYYTQIDTVSETRENALFYLNIMARPLALTSGVNPVHWSNLYVDIIDPLRTTNSDWNCAQNEIQKKRVIDYLTIYDFYPCIERDDDEEWNPEFRKYVFMTTVSMPAFERGVNASLMGVAAIDVPLYEFERLFQKSRLGVGGYAFVVDQNGNILSHPDFRPFFQGKILKPSYNSVDMAELELMDDGLDARNFSSFLLELRESIIDKPSGSKFMFALQPYDDLRRVFRLKRNYFWKRITQTPFTVVVALADHLIGRVHVPEKDSDEIFTKGLKLEKYLKKDYKLHPDWMYCRGIKKSFEDMKLGLIDPDNCEMTPEEELMFYVEKFDAAGWKWKNDKLDSNDSRCDRKLLQILHYDAKTTLKFPLEFGKKSKELSYIEKLNIKNSFIATHSGLLRYKMFDKKYVSAEKWAEKMKKSIDEVWYKRAVDYSREEPDSFVYSVPFNAYNLKKDFQVTATHAIFISEGSTKVPVAVVGYQFSYGKFDDFMKEHCPPGKEDLCYILDEHAIILTSPEGQHAGKFFGAVEKKLMHHMIEDKVFLATKVFDFQGVCYEDRGIKYKYLMPPRSSSVTALLWNPLKSLLAFFSTVISVVKALPSYAPNLIYPYLEHFYDPAIHADQYCQPEIWDRHYTACVEKAELGAQDKGCKEKLHNGLINCFAANGSRFIDLRHVTRTRPIKCDKLNYVYTLTKDESNLYKPYNECSRPYVIQKIPHTNLILLITNRICNQVSATGRDFGEMPREIYYNSKTVFCQKLKRPLFRARPKSCMTHHENEPKFNSSNGDRSYCGRGHRLKLHSLLAAVSIILLLKIFSSK